MSIGDQIKQYRRQKGITQEDLAKELGVKRTTVTQYEAGRIFPSHEILRKMSAFFGVTMDELAGDLPGKEASVNFPNLENASMMAGGKDYAQTMKQLIAQKVVYEISKRETDEFILNNANLFQQLIETILEINTKARQASHSLIQIQMEGDSLDLHHILSEFSKELYHMDKISKLLES